MMKNKNLIINVLGTDFEILIRNQEEMKKAFECNNDSYISGLCLTSENKILIDRECLKDKKVFNRVLRHELIHAFFFCSGLDSQCGFADSEACVDWIAIQSPKLWDCFCKHDILD